MYTQTQIATNKQWRASTHAEAHKRSALVAKNNASPVGNAATEYRELRAGTIMSKLASGKLVPTGLTSVALMNASNSAQVGNASFDLGDLVSIVSSANRAKEVTVNLVAISIVAKVAGLSLVVVDPAGNNALLSSSYNPVNKTITVSSATDGASAPTSTHADLVSELMKFAGLIESASSVTPATLLAALSSTALGKVKGEVIASARTVDAKDGTGKLLTLSGAAITCAEDDIIIKDGAYKPCGILDSTAILCVVNGTSVTAIDGSADLAVEGDARDDASIIIGLPTAASTAGKVMRRALGGNVYADPVGGADVDPKAAGLVGFCFLPV